MTAIQAAGTPAKPSRSADIADWRPEDSEFWESTGKRVAYRNLTAGVVALHRGRKPEDQAIRASTARRTGRARPPIAPAG